MICLARNPFLLQKGWREVHERQQPGHANSWGGHQVRRELQAMWKATADVPQLLRVAQMLLLSFQQKAWSNSLGKRPTPASSYRSPLGWAEMCHGGRAEHGGPSTPSTGLRRVHWGDKWCTLWEEVAFSGWCGFHMRCGADGSPGHEGFPSPSYPVSSAPAWLCCCSCCKTKFNLSLPAGPGIHHSGKGISKSDALKTERNAPFCGC